MLTANLYGSDELLFQNCVISHFDELTSCAKAVRLQCNELTLTLSVIVDHTIRSNDMIVPSWVLEVMKVSSPSKCEYQFVSLDELEGGKSKVELKFKMCQKVRHWDDSNVSLLRIDEVNSWSATWPESLSRKALTAMFPTLLSGFALSNGGIFAVKALDLIVVSIDTL